MHWGSRIGGCLRRSGVVGRLRRSRRGRARRGGGVGGARGGRSRVGGSAGPCRGGTGRRPAHRDDPHHHRTCAAGPCHAHPDVAQPGHPGERRYAASPWIDGAHPRRRAPDGQGFRDREAARDRPDRHRSLGLAGELGCRGQTQWARWSARGGLGGRHPRTDRPGAVPREPFLRAAGLRHRAGRSDPRGARHAGRGARRCRHPGPAASLRRGGPGDHGPGTQRRRATPLRRRRRRRHGRRGRGLPARHRLDREDQETRPGRAPSRHR